MAYLLDVDRKPLQPGDSTSPAGAAAPQLAVHPALLDGLWSACDARIWGLDREGFDRFILLISVRQNFGLPAGAIAGRQEQEAFFRGLKLNDLLLAMACAEGSERAWEHFMTVYGPPLTRAAVAISGSETVGRDLADAFYAELYGLSTNEGKRKCPLDSYRGRGSLIGWLRTTLAQRFVDHFRRTHREEALDEQRHDLQAADEGAGPEPKVLSVLAQAIRSALGDQPAEERFLLASYYLDERTLAEIGKMLGVHEATISRRLKRSTDTVRKRLLKNLEKSGMSYRAAEEALGTDPRDVDLRMDLKKLLQHWRDETFSEEGVTGPVIERETAETIAIPEGIRAIAGEAKTER